MPSLVNTLRRCHSTVRALMNSWPLISGFDRPSRASRAICSACGVSSSRVSALRLRTFSPVRLMAGARAAVRALGKSDPIDALAVARAALREPDLPTAGHDQASWEVKLLVDHREHLVAERPRTINGKRGLLWPGA
jgi:transposase